ncbi:MAG: N-acetylmuramoyl-L-alanine amidase [Chitinophagaceae bacterium]|nr:N-acetylmuramoyl-L-alanine amidase [Chitinophagaceae bacterium]
MENFKRLNLQHPKFTCMTVKTLTIFFPVVFFAITASSQYKLLLDGTAPNEIVNYEVHPGESLSSISKKFGSSVGDVMRLNGMNAQSKLINGSKIKVPVIFAAVSKNESGNTALVHKVQKGESLFGIASKHEISLDQVKKWNQLSKDGVGAGAEIIVGFVNSKGITTETEAIASPVPEKITPPLKNAVANKKASADKKIPDDVSVAQGEPKETKEAIPEKATKAGKAAVKSPVFEDDKIDYSTISEEGFFKAGFPKNVEGKTIQTKSGAAMSFKTASGWTDKKYYIMMNDVEPGTIVKVGNGNGKFVYAKVLWDLGNIKENEGLDFRISNAATSVLGIADEKFTLQVSYHD